MKSRFDDISEGYSEEQPRKQKEVLIAIGRILEEDQSAQADILTAINRLSDVIENSFADLIHEMKREFTTRP